MHKFLLLPLLASAVSLGGCGDQSTPSTGADQQAATSAEPAKQSATLSDAAAEDVIIDVAVDTASNEAVPVTAGQSLTGAFVAPNAGAVQSVSIVIGNNLNTSDGKLAVKICQNGACAEGSADLAGSTDNAYFKVALGQPLVVTADAPVEYTLTKDGGSVPVAVYLFAAQEGSGGTTNDLTSGAATPRLPQFGLEYVQ